MSVNLGSAAFEAITNLRNNADWQQIKRALSDQMQTFMHRSLEVGPGTERTDATGYARALRDLVAHIEQVESPTPSRTPKPSVRAQHG